MSEERDGSHWKLPSLIDAFEELKLCNMFPGLWRHTEHEVSLLLSVTLAPQIHSSCVKVVKCTYELAIFVLGFAYPANAGNIDIVCCADPNTLFIASSRTHRYDGVFRRGGSPAFFRAYVWGTTYPRPAGSWQI